MFVCRTGVERLSALYNIAVCFVCRTGVKRLSALYNIAVCFVCRAGVERELQAVGNGQLGDSSGTPVNIRLAALMKKVSANFEQLAAFKENLIKLQDYMVVSTIEKCVHIFGSI